MLLWDQVQPAIIRQGLIMDMAGLIITDIELIIMVITDGNNVNDIYMVNFFWKLLYIMAFLLRLIILYSTLPLVGRLPTIPIFNNAPTTTIYL